MKTKIINILYHPPAYEAYRNEPRPEINWVTSDDSWVGIGGYDWPDLLGNEVLKLTGEFEYEVWQPDLRADKIYSHIFENGLVHKLFPAEIKKRLYGFKILEEVVSHRLLEEIQNESKKMSIILHINALTNYFNYLIIKNNNLPLLIQFHSKSMIPKIEKYKFRKNIPSNLYYHKIDKLLKKRILTFVYSNSYKKFVFNKYNSNCNKRIFMGIDFEKWNSGNKIEAKKYFKVNKNTIVLSLASRFVNLKQIDKVIKILSKRLFNKYNFKIIIAGHGEKVYDNFLRELSRKLEKQSKIKFVGYLRGEDMLKLYQATDLFISSSVSEGGPVSVMKAIACETSVMCTRVGGVDDILAEHNAGILVDPFDYKQWEKELVAVLEGKKVKILNREIAEQYFHWPNISKKFVDIYKKMGDA